MRGEKPSFRDAFSGGSLFGPAFVASLIALGAPAALAAVLRLALVGGAGERLIEARFRVKEAEFTPYFRLVLELTRQRVRFMTQGTSSIESDSGSVWRSTGR